MTKPLRIGLAGLGTVGLATLTILEEQAALVAKRSGREIIITAISARDKNKNRGRDFAVYEWVDDPAHLAQHANVDVVVELMGGAEGAARILVEAALKAGKPVVTANKALIAGHGLALSALVEKHSATLAFEAAVAGGIPIIKTLRDGLATNNILRIAGILNGTCNYILTHMWQGKRSFADVLSEAQTLGYAEAEPSFDVDGVDTAHKLSILTALAYGVPPDTQNMYIEGIRHIALRDLQFADELGYAIKLLGITSSDANGLRQRVYPAMIPKNSPLASVNGAFNAVLVEGDAVGTILLEGAGAGAKPTASAVVSDIIDIARGSHYKPFAIATAAIKPAHYAPANSLNSSYYLRLGVVDKPGVLAEVTQIFKEEKISLQSFLQHSHQTSEAVQIVITTHETSEGSMLAAIERIAKLPTVAEPPFMIRIEKL